ncbi:Ff.00g106660.m01.CDS01 [Fusarium sp. VM40]|nr:Ff.00g106660.m01.CDS01 [Fusarium sp. VM40]
MSSFAVVKDIDHLVLTCTDVSATVEWYTKYLGMKAETFTSATDPSATPRTALKFGTHKINLHQRGAEFEPKAQTALPGTADLCFVVEDGTDLQGLIGKFEKEGIEVLEGGKVVSRTGALGKIQSIYVRDPDGNLIELSYYST